MQPEKPISIDHGAPPGDAIDPADPLADFLRQAQLRCTDDPRVRKWLARLARGKAAAGGLPPSLPTGRKT
jgi:hypothetical protein